MNVRLVAETRDKPFTLRKHVAFCLDMSKEIEHVISFDTPTDVSQKHAMMWTMFNGSSHRLQ